MAHSLVAAIAKAGSLSQFAADNALHAPIQLAQGFEIVPFRDQDLERFWLSPGTNNYNGLPNLTEELAHALKKASASAPIAYIETDYFGGVGCQGAMVFSDGNVQHGPNATIVGKVAATGPINDALRYIGIKVERPVLDEFEAIGLHLHRDAESWINPRPVTGKSEAKNRKCV